MTSHLRDVGRSPRRQPQKMLALVVALAALTAGCVRAGGPDVKVNALDAELVFGVKEKDAAPTPPEAPTPPSTDPFFPTDFPTNPFDIPLFNDPPKNPCPDEFTKANPQRDADVTVTGDLSEGGYRFRGTLLRNLNSRIEVSTLPEETRVVKNYKRVKNGAGDGVDLITYDYIQPFGTQFLQTTFQVKALVQNSTSVRPPTENVYEGTPRVRSDPEAGVVIKRTALVDAKGNAVPGAENFNPQTGLLLLPLPVESSDFASTAVDSASGRTLVNQASVKARERLSACGEPVDGWYVDAFIAISERDNPAAQDGDNQFRWQMVIAPQYAGLIIGEVIDRTYSGNRPNETLIRSILSLEPTPTT